MARRKMEKGPADPKIRIIRQMDCDFSSHLEVTLGPGSSISVVEPPIARSGELTSRPLARGLWWTTATDAKLAFGLGGATNASALVVDDENRFLVAADLVFAWTDGIVLQAVDAPGLPGLSWVSGLGTLVLRPPGYLIAMAGWYRRQPYVLVDPAHFAFAKTDGPAAEIVTDEHGRDWIRLAGQGGQVHTFDRRSTPVADAIPPREP